MLKLFLAVLALQLVFPEPINNATALQSENRVPFYEWAKRPPMGWNSWDCFGPTVVEGEVKANADYMSRYLRKYGWDYIVIDIRWYVENDKSGGYNETDPRFVIDEYGRYLPAVNRFPSAADGKGFKPIADYIHGKGLRFGIHVMRGIPVMAVRKNTPVPGTNLKAQDIYNPEDQCPWLRDNYTIDSKKEGGQAYYNSLFQLYASWGVDFVKVDDLAGHQAEIEMIRKAIDNSGRAIVLSISPGPARIDQAEFLKNNANMWRTVGDFWDNWPQLKSQFAICAKWAPHIGNGHFPDADMLPLGKIGVRAERGAPRMTGFTKDEQYTVMSLFAIFRSPLMFGGDLPDNDEFTLSLLTNKEVLRVNQYSINNKQLFRDGDIICWTADDPGSGDKYLALFNASDSQVPIGIKVSFEQLAITGTHKVKNLWTGKNLGKFSGEFKQSINAHGAGIYRIYN
jgi:alpha-galactosidase